MNEDIIKERAAYNVHFKQSEGGYESTFDRMCRENIISTRGLGKDPFIVDELVFDVNSAYFENNGGYDYAVSFFEEAYRCAVEEIGGEQFVLSAVMHADERNSKLSEQQGRDIFHYHLHVVYVPVVQKEIYFRKNNKDPELAGKLKEVITQVSHSKKWPRYKQLEDNGEVKRNDKGKPILVNAYSLLQDHFFEHMRAAGFTDFERGERGSTAEHLTVLEFKTKAEAERAAALEEKADKAQKQLDGLEKKTAIAKKEAADFADIERMGDKRTIGGNVLLSPADWKKVSGLAKEGVKSRGIIAGLKKQIAGFIEKIKELTQKLKKYDMGLNDQMKYLEAMHRAPRRLAETVADIRRQPPENQQQRTTPERKRDTNINI